MKVERISVKVERIWTEVERISKSGKSAACKVGIENHFPILKLHNLIKKRTSTSRCPLLFYVPLLSRFNNHRRWEFLCLVKGVITVGYFRFGVLQFGRNIRFNDFFDRKAGLDQ